MLLLLLLQRRRHRRRRRCLRRCLCSLFVSFFAFQFFAASVASTCSTLLYACRSPCVYVCVCAPVCVYFFAVLLYFAADCQLFGPITTMCSVACGCGLKCNPRPVVASQPARYHTSCGCRWTALLPTAAAVVVTVAAAAACPKIFAA